CAASGAEVRQGHVAAAAEREGDRWRIVVNPESGPAYTVRARFIVDASGRDTFLAQRLRSKRMAENHRRIAIYAHFRGVERDPGIDAGNTVVVAMRNGWFWSIPLGTDRDSIGLVVDGDAYRASKLSPEEAFDHAIARSEEMGRRMRNAERVSPVHATSNF